MDKSVERPRTGKVVVPSFINVVQTRAVSHLSIE